MADDSKLIFRVKRGLKYNLPNKAQLGELLYCTDTNQLYIGQGIEETSSEVRLLNPSGYTYYQDVDSNSWVIEHNLGKYPSVTTTLVSGEVFYGKITYLDDKKVRIDLSKSLAGFAHFN